jgi:hypothetical protein
LTIMKDCCPEEAHYFEARLADVQDLFPDKKKK